MINARTIRKLRDGDGLTLKNGAPITYKTGYQVATEGIETRSATEASKAVRAYHGNCGLWYSDGIYYVDKSHREPTKKKALEVGREHHQISIFGWAKSELVYC